MIAKENYPLKFFTIQFEILLNLSSILK